MRARLPRQPLQAAVPPDLHAASPPTGLERPARPPRHRGARGAAPQGRPRAHRRRHLPPPRLRLRPRPPAGASSSSTSGEYDVAFLLRPTAGRAGPGDRRGGRVDAAEVDLLLPEGPDRTDLQSFGLTAGTIESHEGSRPPHRDVPPHGRRPRAPRDRRRAAGRRAATTPPRARRSCSPPASPRARRSRWRCTPQRKGWDLGYVEVECEYTPAERGCPTKFDLVLRLPDDATDEQVERLKVIAAKCPVHRTLDGEVMFHERVERARARHGLSSPPRCAASCSTRPRPRRSTSTAAPTPPSSSRSSSHDGEPHARLHQAPRRPAPPRRRDLVPGRARGRRRRRPRPTPRCARRTRRSACRPTPSRSSARCSRRRRSRPATPSIRSSG